MHVQSGKEKGRMIHSFWEDSVKELAVINRSSCISKNIDINQSKRNIGSHMASAFDYPHQDYV